MFLKPEEVITNEEIEAVHANACFGDGISKREVVNYAVLKCACGFYQGATSRRIAQEHGLIGKNYTITKKGKKYIWAVFGEEGF